MSKLSWREQLTEMGGYEKAGNMRDEIPADTSKLEESFSRLPQLTYEEKAALNEIPDNAVSHWVQGEKWDFEKQTWIRFPVRDLRLDTDP